VRPSSVFLRENDVRDFADLDTVCKDEETDVQCGNDRGKITDGKTDPSAFSHITDVKTGEKTARVDGP
jgi:hypothetical protein